MGVQPARKPRGIMQFPVKSSEPLMTTIMSPTLNTAPDIKRVNPLPKCWVMSWDTTVISHPAKAI